MRPSQKQPYYHEEFLQPTVQAITNALDLPSSIWLVDEKQEMLQIAATADLLTDYTQQACIHLQEQTVLTEVFRTGKRIYVPDISADTRWKYKQEARNMGLRAAVVSPIFIKNSPVGVFNVYIPENKEVDIAKQQMVIDSFTSQLSATLRQIRGLTILNEVGSLINLLTKETQDFYQRIVQSAHKVLQCNHVSIFLLDKEKHTLQLKATSADHIKRTAFRLGEGLASYVAETKKMLLVLDAHKDPHFIPGLSTDPLERSMLLAPILFQTNCIGVISADRYELNGFDEYDKQLLETLASQVAIAIYNLQLFKTIQEQQQQAELVQKVARSVNSTLDRREVIGLALDHLHEFIEYDSASIQIIQGDYRTFIGYQLFSPDTLPEKKFQDLSRESPEQSIHRLHRNVSEDPLIKDIIQSKHPKVLSDTHEASSEEWQDFPETTYIKSWIGVPLVVREEVIGLLTIEHTQPGFCTEQTGEKVALFADLVATALLNTDLYQREHEKTETLTTLHEITNKLLTIEQSSDPKQLLHNIAASALNVLKADLIDLYEYQAEKKTCILPPISKGERYVPDIQKDQIYKDDIILQFIDKRTPYYIENSQKDPTFSSPYLELPDQPSQRFVFREKIQSTAVISLKTGQEIMGLMFMNYRMRQGFTPEQKKLIELFANQAAIAIKNSRLYLYINQRQKALVDVAKNLTIAMTQSEQEVFELIYKEANEKLEMKHFSIALCDENREDITFVLASRKGVRVDLTKEVGWKRRWNSERKTERIIVSGKPLCLNSLGEVKNDGFSPIPEDKDIEGKMASSWLGVPMKVGQKVLGVIANYHYEEGKFFTQDDIDIFQALADQAAIAIQNTRLYHVLIREQNLFRALTENMPDQIYVKNTKCEFIFANAAVAQVRKVGSPRNVLGKTDIDFFPEQEARRSYDKEQMILQTSEALINEEGIVRNLDGTIKRATLTTKVPFYHSSGKIAGIVGIGRDITDRKQAEEQLQRALSELTKSNEELRELDRRKSEFLSTVSHELRTPLATIKGFIENLLAQIYGPLTEKQRDSLQRALARANEETLLIENLLDLVRIQENRVQFDLEFEDMLKIVQDVVQVFEVQAERKHIVINTQFSKEHDLQTRCDRSKVKQVLSNLIGNGLKFTPEGGMITILVSNDNQQIMIQVRDTGIGIPVDKLEKIFDRFYQIDSSLTRPVGGIGIGLNIAKEYIELHGGKIWAESRPGAGAMFTFTLPKVDKAKNSEGEMI